MEEFKTIVKVVGEISPQMLEGFMEDMDNIIKVNNVSFEYITDETTHKAIDDLTLEFYDSFNVLTVFYTFLVINLKCSSIVILAPNATFLQLKSDLPPQFAHLVIFYRILDIKTHICWLWEIFCVPINILELLSGEQLFHLYQHQNFILLVLDVRILSQNQKYLL